MRRAIRRPDYWPVAIVEQVKCRLSADFSVRSMTLLFLATMLLTAQGEAEIVRPTVRLELRLTAEEVPELRRLLLRFAESHGLQVDDVGAKLPVSRVMPPVKGRRPFMLRLKRPDIAVGVDDFMEQHKFGVYVYELRPGSDVRQVVSELESVLHARWPDKLRPFADP